jgi:hypothetical protein
MNIAYKNEKTPGVPGVFLFDWLKSGQIATVRKAKT